MNISDFDVFLAAARLRNLHRAADECDIAQSSVSKAIARLEALYEVRLFNRAASGVTLTAEGEAMLACASRLRTTLDDIADEMRARKYGSLGRIRLGSVPGMIEPVIVPIVMAMMSRAENVRYSVNAKLSPALYRDVELGELDLALVTHSEPVSRLLGHELIDIMDKGSYQVVAGKNHPLVGSRLEVKALADQRWVLPSQEVQHRVWLDRLLQSHGLAPADVLLETDAHAFSMAPLLRRSNLLTVLPRGMLRFPALKDLVALDVDAGKPDAQLAIIWRKNTYMSPLIHEVRRALHKQLAVFHADKR